MSTRSGARDFEIFKKEFERCQKAFGLNGYKVYFKHEPLDGCFAEIYHGEGNQTVTVRLNSNIPEKDLSFKDPRKHAKHEALHLLIARLEECGRERYVRSGEIYEACEELVRRLETLIP
jgi:hypothetical protein